MTRSAGQAHPVWDIPTRVFHWFLVIAIGLSWWCAENEDFERHALLGYAVLVAVVFRLIWGFVGSVHSRFSDFVRRPSAAFSYLKTGSYSGPGHNPLGAWSVLALLLLLFLQAFSGLFNSDDLLFQGPFYYGASVAFRDTMGVVHEWAFDGLLVLVVLHILAVAYYQRIKRQPLVQAMVRGSAQGKEGVKAAVAWWKALPILVILSATLWWLIQSAPKPAMLW